LQAAACRATVGSRVLINSGRRPSSSSRRRNGLTAPSRAMKNRTALFRGVCRRRCDPDPRPPGDKRPDPQNLGMTALVNHPTLKGGFLLYISSATREAAKNAKRDGPGLRNPGGFAPSRLRVS